MTAAERWRRRGRTLEAAGFLVIARLLVGRVKFAHWRPLLGSRLPLSADRRATAGSGETAERVAAAVDRAATRLGGSAKCLPRAIAAQWMLRRRGVPAVVHLGVMPGRERGTLDDLHAWTTVAGEDGPPSDPIPHIELLRFGGLRFDHPATAERARNSSVC